MNGMSITFKTSDASFVPMLKVLMDKSDKPLHIEVIPYGITAHRENKKMTTAFHFNTF